MNNTFLENVRPISVHAQRIDSTLYGNSYIDNDKNYIEVQGDVIDENGTFVWAMDGAPYMVNGDIYVQRSNNGNQLSTLKIESGTEIWFGSGSDLFIGHESNGNYRGALQAEGVTFTRSQGNETWPGIDIRHYSVDDYTYLNNCIVEYATDGINCQNSNPTLTNNIFRYNTDGVEADNSAIPKISDNTFLENVRPISVHALRIDSTLYGNSYIDNDKNYIEVQGDVIDENGTFVWAMDGAPYMVNGDIYVQRANNGNQLSTLKIEPGTEVWFGSGSNLFIGHESNNSYRGALQAEGVTFTRSQGIETWPGIDIRHYSVDDYTYLNNCIIEYATDGIYCQFSNPTLTNNIFRYNTDGVEA